MPKWLQATIATHSSQARPEQVECPASNVFVVAGFLLLEQHGEQHQRNSLGTVGERKIHGLPVVFSETTGPLISLKFASRHQNHAYREIKRARRVPVEFPGVGTPRRGRMAHVSPCNCPTSFGWSGAFLWEVA